ncbi:prion-like-(Q N-rich) domain-bearing 25 [Brachionus plicatilis]|uniref:Prion-like-(Q N-rich) domain-bearing 25 n=1 Tax=Brachionus plicatilis TaxID=10195 RepID=A0A3M7QKM3_BRAPC|nr:prion-like-(Q N-rich) domain-bearing 25 [Brachionus plicatilis]
MEYNESEKFVRNVLADRSSYILNGYSDDHFYQFEYRVEKSEAVRNLELHENGLVEVPRWIVYFCIPVMIFLIAFFTGALVTMGSVKSDAIYGQSCADRSCSKEHNLKCINKVCQCESPKYYTNKCVDLSKYEEKCASRDKCDPSQDLICFGSICSCAPTKYWNSESSKCVDRLTYGQTCNGDQCKIRINLVCSSLGFCQCIDNTLYFWDDSVKECVAKKRYSLPCSSDNQCLDSETTICKNNQNCLCTDTKYFNGVNCIDRVGELISCTYDDMCKIPMYCDSNDGCKCLGDYFFSTLYESCIEKISSQIGLCEANHHCRTDLNLECDLSTNMCKCMTSYTWSSSQNSCELTYTKGECDSDSDCNLSEGLVCYDQSYYSCDCPTSSVRDFCDCPRSNAQEMYWDSSLASPQCVVAKAYLEECSNDFECRTNIEKTKCINQVCSCEEPGGWLPASQICKKCNNGDIFFDTEGLCYHFSTDQKDGDDVDDDCTLAKIKNFDILDFIIENADPDNKYWINGRKRGDGRYTYFDSNELINSAVCPNFDVDNERMLNYDPDIECFKNDVDDDDDLRYICEY